MKEALLSLGPSDIRALSVAIETGRLSPPYLPSSIERFVKGDKAVDVAVAIQGMEASGMSQAAIARALDLVATGISSRPLLEDLVDLVTTGPELGGVANRDTSAVVQELFRRSKRSVLVAGYAIHQGQRVFHTLADQMVEYPDLKVQMFLDIQRRPGDTSAASEIVREFYDRFRTTQWPCGHPFPEIFYDPRSLALKAKERAAIHAKCVIVDNLEVFVSSANFTEAAQQKNIEVGLRLRSAVIAERIERFFQSLAEHGRVVRLV